MNIPRIKSYQIFAIAQLSTTGIEILVNFNQYKMNISGNNLHIKTVNSTLTLECEVKTDIEDIIVGQIEYYVDGVTLSVIAILGLLANTATLFILFKQKTTDTNFSSLLLCLFLFDAIILLTGVLMSFQTYLEISSNTQIILSPFLVYPLQHISMTASIFMTVAIAHERYNAIRQPVQYRQMMVDANVRKKHFMKYILSIIFVSLIFNIPKFFEISVQWIPAAETIPRPYHAIDESLLRYVIL